MTPGRLLRSVLHTRPEQLKQRLLRVVRESWHDRAPSRTARAVRGAAPSLSAVLPRPVFAPRTDRVALVEGLPKASFLNVTHSLAPGIDWSPPRTTDLERMNLHYMEFLEGLDDQAFERVVREWIDANPLARRGAWRIAWNSYALSLRALVWMQQIAVRGLRFDAAFREIVLRSLAEQLRFLETHLELDIVGNHLIKNAKTLSWAGRFFEGAEAERWRALGQQILEEQLAEQVLADGMHYERSPAYHAQVFADLVECAHVSEGVFRESLIAVIGRMARPLVDLAHPDGAPSLFNDGGLSMAYTPEECLAAAESLGVGRPAPQSCFEYRDSGYFGLRFEQSCVVVDCGDLAPDFLPAHGHGDALAFEWSLGGKRIFVDAGVFEYQRGPLRDQSRSTRSHNTVTLDDLDQSEFWSSFRVGRRAKVKLERFERLGPGFVLEGVHDGYAHLRGAPLHRRRVIAGRESLVIDDEVIGGARQSVRARFLLHPEVTVEARAKDFVLRHGDVAVVMETRGGVDVVESWWFPDFGVRQRTRQIVVTYSPAPSRGFTRLQRVPLSALEPHTGWTGFMRRIAA